VDHLVVHRGADRRRKAHVALERRDGALVPDRLLGDDVQVERRHARLDGPPQQVQSAPDHQPRGTHLLQLLRRLDLDSVPVSLEQEPHPQRLLRATSEPYPPPNTREVARISVPPPRMFSRHYPKNGRIASIARWVTSSTGTVASSPTRMSSSA